MMAISAAFMVRTLVATTTRTAMPGMVMKTSVMVRMTVSTTPRK